MAQEFYVREDNSVSGPFTGRQLRDMASSGELTPDSLVSINQRKWLPASSIKELVFEVAAPENPGPTVAQRMRAGLQGAATAIGGAISGIASATASPPKQQDLGRVGLVSVGPTLSVTNTLAEPVAPEDGRVMCAVWLGFRGIEWNENGSSAQYGWGPQWLQSGATGSASAVVQLVSFQKIAGWLRPWRYLNIEQAGSAMRHRKTIRNFHEPGQLHEFTFSCFQRRPLLTNNDWCRRLARHIDAACDAQRIDLVAFVYMPEHIHLLTCPRQPDPNLGRFLAQIKQPFSKEIKELLIEHQSLLLNTLVVQERTGKFCFRYWQEGPAGWPRFSNLGERSDSEARLPWGDLCAVLLRETLEHH